MEKYNSFEELDQEYARLKLKVEKYKTDLEKFEADLENAKKDKENAENALKVAKPKEKQKFQDDLNKAIIAIEDIKANIELTKLKQERNGTRLSELIESVKSIPEVSEQCKQALDKNTERKIAKFEKQKKEQEEKKSALTDLKNIIQKHPQAQIFVNNIETKSLEISKRELEIRDIETKIKELDPKDANYAADKAELEADKGKLEGECTKLKSERQTERDGLKKLLNNPKYNEHIDNLTTRSALDKDINNCDRLIRRSENKINDYTQANENLYKEENPTPTPPTTPAPPTNPPTKWGTFKENFKNIFAKKEPGDPSRLSRIGKVFKDLFTKQETLPLPTAPTAPTAPAKLFKDDIKVENAMQYQVVRDLFETDKNKVADEVKKSSEAREAAKKDDGSR